MDLNARGEIAGREANAASPNFTDNLNENVDLLSEQAHPLLERALAESLSNLVPTVTGDVVFTDQRAPVETIVDTLVIRYLLEEGPSGLVELGG